MRIETDFIVLGSGIAGLSFALKASKLGQVAIVTKATIFDGASGWAQGGIAAVFSKNDSFESHAKDTLDAGSGLCDPNVVELTVREGPSRVQELIDLGVPFTKKEPTTNEDPESCPYDLTKEGGHHERRILHASDFTGRAIQEALVRAIRENSNIKVYENHTSIDLITNYSRSKIKQSNRTRMLESRKCLGVYVLDQKNQDIHTFSAAFTILATGGAGKVYLYTSNPDTATGDGIAMAYRSGARVSNMEFMQFHPTCLFHPQAKSFLISEALRGEGGELIDQKGRAFMKSYHPLGSLAPRDIVARAIDSEIKRTGADCVFLDMPKKNPEFLKNRFPNIHKECLKFGIDMTTQPIPVVPAAHYTCGGVLTDVWGESSVTNLFAIGEVSNTGLHGANRLASNSLLEGVVFAHRAYLQIEKRIQNNVKLMDQVKNLPEPLPEWDSGHAIAIEERININHTWKELRTLMWNYVGIVRTNRRLEKAKVRLEIIKNEVQEYYWNYLLTSDLIELRNIVTNADLIIQCALLRKESRGLHYNMDYPFTDDIYFKRSTVL